MAQLSERPPLLCGTTTRRAAACGAVALVKAGWSPRIAAPAFIRARRVAPVGAWASQRLRRERLGKWLVGLLGSAAV